VGERGADYAFLVTSEDDRLAQRYYEAAGFRRTEGEGDPLTCKTLTKRSAHTGPKFIHWRGD